jgi:peptidoglycan hydrolase CwlO-like protein
LENEKQNAVGALEKLRVEHEEEKAIYTKQVSSLESYLRTTQQELSDLEGKRDSERTQLNELVAQVATLSKLISDSESILASESQDSESQLKSVSDCIDKLTSDVNSKLSRIDQLSTEASELQDQIGHLNSDNSAKASQIEQLEHLVNWGTSSLSDRKLSSGSDKFDELKVCVMRMSEEFGREYKLFQTSVTCKHNL